HYMQETVREWPTERLMLVISRLTKPGNLEAGGSIRSHLFHVKKTPSQNCTRKSPSIQQDLPDKFKVHQGIPILSLASTAVCNSFSYSGIKTPGEQMAGQITHENVGQNLCEHGFRGGSRRTDRAVRPLAIL